MNDRELIKIYSVGMFMLSLLDEWNKLERTGDVAKVYNTITRKHSNFHQQFKDVKSGKRKKYSHKCDLFIYASALATVAWKESIESAKNIKMSVNTVLYRLYGLNSDGLKRIYGLNGDVFESVRKQGSTEVVFSSCKVANIMAKNISEIIDHKIDSSVDSVEIKRISA